MTKKDKNEIGIQRQGLLHEEAALKLIGGDAENLNNNPKLEDMGLHAGNYPNFDIFSSKEICSVKSHFTQDGSPNIQSYKNDFSKMLGWGKAYDSGLSPLEQDAKRITECATRGIPVPAEIQKAGQDQVVQYLKEKSVMRIPTDHVGKVRSALVDDARNLPSNYFLPDNPTEEQLTRLGDRVQSTSLSSIETFEQMKTDKRNLSETKNHPENDKKDAERTAQGTASGIAKMPVADVDEQPSEDEDYYYGYGY